MWRERDRQDCCEVYNSHLACNPIDFSSFTSIDIRSKSSLEMAIAFDLNWLPNVLWAKNVVKVQTEYGDTRVMIDQAYSQAGTRWFSVTKGEKLSVRYRLAWTFPMVGVLCVHAYYVWGEFVSLSLLPINTAYDHLKRSSINSFAFIRYATRLMQ